MRANGTFEVKMTPQSAANGDETNAAAAVPGRLLMDKQFHGELQATSRGQMLAARTAIAGSAGYVAIEQVSGTLHERSGTFILQHSGTMTRGVPHLTITVVPDSGTGDLTGLAGHMTIHVNEGKHSYEFDYTLAETA